MGIVIPFPADPPRGVRAGAPPAWPGSSVALALRWWKAAPAAPHAAEERGLRFVLLSAHGAEMALEPIAGLAPLIASARRRLVRE